MKRDELVEWLDGYLDISAIDDYSYNGLQFEGKEDVKRVIFAVDAGVETFQKSEILKGDMLVVHHGLFWKKQNPKLTGVNLKRVSQLFKSQISLYGVHLPLDKHIEVGNNVELIRLSGAKLSGTFYNDFGALGKFAKPINQTELQNLLNKKLRVEESFLLTGGNSEVSKIATLSGAASRDVLQEAANLGVDLLITGERIEFYHDAQDYGISVLFMGHNASETVGIKALMKKVEKKFAGLECQFLDIPTGL